MITLSLKIIFLVGVIVMIVSTVGIGGNLNSSTLFKKIGADENISLPVDADVTNILLKKSSGNFDRADVTVKNTDSNSHSYDVCLVAVHTDEGLSHDAGENNSMCTSTSSISSGSTETITINFDNVLTDALPSLTSFNVSIQEIT